jgi:hypothetical protein
MDGTADIIRFKDERVYMQRYSIVLVTGIVMLYAVPVFIIGQEPWSLYSMMRGAGICGLISLSLGVLLNLNKRAVKSVFKRPFLRVHHTFVIIGLFLISLHPLLYAYLTGYLGVFIPDITSLYTFFETGGLSALLLIYLAFFEGLVRMMIRKHSGDISMPGISWIASCHSTCNAHWSDTQTPPLVSVIVYGLFFMVCISGVAVRMNGRRQTMS